MICEVGMPPLKYWACKISIHDRMAGHKFARMNTICNILTEKKNVDLLFGKTIASPPSKHCC